MNMIISEWCNKNTKKREEVWQCDNCGKIFIGITAKKNKTKYNSNCRIKIKPKTRLNPYISAITCCIITLGNNVCVTEITERKG